MGFGGADPDDVMPPLDPYDMPQCPPSAEQTAAAAASFEDYCNTHDPFGNPLNKPVKRKRKIVEPVGIDPVVLTAVKPCASETAGPCAREVLCLQPDGGDPVKRTAIGKSTPVVVPSPGRTINVDYDMLIRALCRIGCKSPACSDSNKLVPRTEQHVAGGSLVVTCVCPACGVAEPFNLAGFTVPSKNQTQPHPYRSEMEAREMVQHMLAGGQYSQLAERHRLRGVDPAVAPSKNLWLATEQLLSGASDEVCEQYLAEGRDLFRDVENGAVCFDAGHNHVRKATAAQAAFVVCSPASHGGLILEANVISKKLSKFDREELNLERHHYEKSRDPRGMEAELGEGLAKQALEHEICVKYLITDRDSSAWKRMKKYFEQLPVGFIRRAFCIGHDLMNFKKELVKMITKHSRMVDQSLCLSNIGGTCGRAEIKGKKKGTVAEGQRVRCNKMTAELAQEIKRAMSTANYEVLTPDNCKSEDSLPALKVALQEKCKEKMTHFTTWDKDKHPTLKGKRLTCFAEIAGVAAATNTYVVDRVQDHFVPALGAAVSARGEGLHKQLLKFSPKATNLSGIEAANNNKRGIAINAEIPICKRRKIEKVPWMPPAQRVLARACEKELRLENYSLLSKAGTARLIVNLKERVSHSTRRSKPEHKKKQREAANTKRIEAFAAKGANPSDAKGYKARGALEQIEADAEEQMRGSDTYAEESSPVLDPNVCTHCGLKTKPVHKTGRARLCTVEGKAKYAAEKAIRDAAADEAEESAKAKKPAKIEKPGQEVVAWFDPWKVAQLIEEEMAVEPGVYHGEDATKWAPRKPK